MRDTLIGLLFLAIAFATFALVVVRGCADGPWLGELPNDGRTSLTQPYPSPTEALP